MVNFYFFPRRNRNNHSLLLTPENGKRRRGLRRFFLFFFKKISKNSRVKPIIFRLIGEFSIFIFETKRMLQDKVSTTEFLSSLQKIFLNRKRKRSPVLVRVLASGVKNFQVEAFNAAVAEASNLGMLENVKFELLHTEEVSYTLSV